MTDRLHDRKTVPAALARDVAGEAPPQAAADRIPDPPGLKESVADVLHESMKQL